MTPLGSESKTDTKKSVDDGEENIFKFHCYRVWELSVTLHKWGHDGVALLMSAVVVAAVTENTRILKKSFKCFKILGFFKIF